MSKRLEVDMRGDRLPAQVVDLAASWPLHIPAKGFECVDGAQALRADLLKRHRFLVALSRPEKEVSIPEDLYVEFSNLGREGIVDFANRYGTLRVSGEHFHREPEMRSSEGEPLDHWIRETSRFKAALDLWYEAQSGTRKTVRRLLSRVLNPSARTTLLRFPPYSIDDPAEHARAIVVTTINAGLSPAEMPPRRCELPGCHFEPMPWVDATRAWLRTTSGQAPDLVIISTNLIKTLWTQFACLVAGKRKLKRCEASDCKLGGYMDVTNSERPGARRMHPTCAERLKKRKYRRPKAEKRYHR
jgi:hypothetical protein